ncbi:SusC/RagA family TonB-linked outer membrane protein [Prolixibacteraceae bacterium JC049]|nr:SusC/RagA family TonB-linked outer membrane protein [Prolixibacteraceae bacterium JC049]
MYRYILLLLMLFPVWVFGQNCRDLKGIILDRDSKEPLIGATIMIPDQELKNVQSTIPAYGTTADLDGRFTLAVLNGVKTVTISFIGYLPQQVNVKGKDFVTVYLSEDKKELETVTVTGYRNIQKRKLTAAVAKVKVKEIAAGGIMSVDQMLEGQLAGVSAVTTSGAPGAASKIRIRGTASLKGKQDPLWVLDGFPLEGTDLPNLEENNIDELYSSSIAGLNPSDIENITVLKDAAATAIYGARAANGVIVITTKKGKKGRMKVNFSSKVSYSLKPNIDKLNLMSSDEKIDLELALARSDYDYLKGKGAVARILNGHGIYDAYRTQGNTALTPAAKAEIDALRGVNTDWNDLLFRGSLNTDQSLSVSGGGENSTYYLSLGYYNEKGTTVGVDADRINLTSKISFSPSRKLRFGVSILANQRKNNSYLTNSNGFTNPGYYSRRANPYLTPRDANGNYVYDPDIQGYGFNDNLIHYNIFEERTNTSNNLTSRSVNSIFDMEWNLAKNLTFTSQFGLQLDYYTKAQWADKNSYSTRKDIERSRLQSGPFLPTNGGVIKNRDEQQSQWNLKNMLKYSNSWDDKHELDLLVGNEVRKTNFESNFSAAYGYNNQTLTSQPVNYPDESWQRYFPLFKRVENENAFVSVFGTASYTLNKKYTIGSSIRFDGSDVFGVDPKYKYLPLYSFSGLWRVSEENFLQFEKWINNLAVRASYGLQGNIDKNTSPFVLGKWENISILPGHTIDGISVEAPPNKKLRWEKTRTYNFGFDLAVLDYAFALQVDYYHRNSTDLIGSRDVPLETGFLAKTENWAAMTNEGFEISLNTRNIKRKNFLWETTFNLSHNTNKVDKVSVKSNQTTPSLQGHPVNSIFVLPYAGLDQDGYPLLYNNDGEKVTVKEFFQLTNGVGNVSVATQLTPEQQRALYKNAGSRDPLYSGGITNRFKYKNWDLTMVVIANLGHKTLIRPYYSMTQYDRGQNAKNEILGRWTPENTSSNLPRLITANTLNGSRAMEYNWINDFKVDRSLDLWVRDADEIRLSNVRLGYTIPTKFLNKLKLASAKITFEGRNLWIWGKDSKGFMDPLTMSNEFAQPIPKVFTFGLNVGF